MRRREFMRGVVVGGMAASVVAGRAAAGRLEQTVTIAEPFDGAVLNRRHGKQTAGGLAIRVRGTAPPGKVAVNGVVAKRSGQAFETEVVLRQRETVLSAVWKGSTAGGGKAPAAQARVVWDRHSFPRYRFSIDDLDQVSGAPRLPCGGCQDAAGR